MSYTATFTGNIISFVAATSITWTSPTLSILENESTTPFPSPLSSEETAWISALLPLGAVFGPFIYGYLADWIGRKKSLLICGVPFVLSYLVLAFAKMPWMYYAARFLAGTSVGGVFAVIPIYVGEIAEDSNRGALGVSMNCFVCTGLLFSYIVGPFVSIMTFNLMLAVFPVLYLVLFFVLAPETLQHDRGDVKVKIEERRGTFLDIFRSKGTVKAFIIAVGLMTFQQFSGINAVLFFAQDIFEAAGASLEPEICSIIIGCTQLAASLLSPPAVERLGRKFLLLLSIIGIIVSEVPLGVYSYLKDEDKDVSGISFLPILCLVGYIISYNVGMGPVPWAMLGELFPTNIKSIASSAVAAFCWFLGFLITKYFKSVLERIGMGPSFWIFSGCSAVAVPFFFFYVVETKGKSLREIQDVLKG